MREAAGNTEDPVWKTSAGCYDCYGQFSCACGTTQRLTLVNTLRYHLQIFSCVTSLPGKKNHPGSQTRNSAERDSRFYARMIV